MEKTIKKVEALEILNKLEYPTDNHIIAFAITYPNLFRNILKNKQIKEIIEVR